MLERLHLLTIQDLLLHFPIAQQGPATVTPIAKLRAGSDANIVAQIIDVRGKRYGGKEKIEALLGRCVGAASRVWWSPYVASKARSRLLGVLFRQSRLRRKQRGIRQPEFEVISEPAKRPTLRRAKPGRIVPV